MPSSVLFTLLALLLAPAFLSAQDRPAALAHFSGDRALADLKTLQSFGPRPPSSAGYEKSLQFLEKTLKEAGWTTTRQSFQSVTPTGPLRFTNLLARFGEVADWEQSTPFLLSSHLDTKRVSAFRFMGANDSGSSTVVLTEIARVTAKHDPALARELELVFFDGEEAILKDIDPKRDGLYGSRYYASRLNDRKSKPKTGILLDLVGDKNVPLLVGLDSGRKLLGEAGRAVQTLGLRGKVRPASYLIIDDHVPLIKKAKIPMLHIIGDFARMPYWHKKGDTIDKIHPEALTTTAQLTLQVLHQLRK